MKIYRKCLLKMEDLQIGDQIKVKLKGFGKFTATLQQIDPEGFMFMFDQCIAKKAMNKSDTNEGEYDASDLRKWLDSSVINAFPKKLRKRIEWITLPSAEQIFDSDNRFINKYFESTNDTFFPLMKKRKNRMAFFKDDLTWYWLRNATKKDIFASLFATVDGYGNASYIGASRPFNGIRPIFRIQRKENENG